MTRTATFARWFPLVARPRPACPPLIDRVADLRRRAERAERDGNKAAASAVHNLAALIASDCGLPDLAREWCHRHALLHLTAHPLDAASARYALEPLVNLARLLIRGGQGNQAAEFIESLYAAVARRAQVTIDGIQIPADLTNSDQAHQDLRRWLWAVVLATSARAYAVAGRWQEAAASLRAHKGIGKRMLDGRQAAVLARITSGDTTRALDLLNETEPGKPWENAVAACLRLHCHAANDTETDDLVSRYDLLDPCQPGLVAFRTRLGLSFIDVLDTEHPRSSQLAAKVIVDAIAAQDGYAARDILRHDSGSFALTDPQRTALSNQVDACALDHGSIPPTPLAGITAAMNKAEQVIAGEALSPRTGSA